MTAIVSVIGKDRVGIIAKVSQFMADHQVNILDISQTIMNDYFTMIMMVDLSGSPKETDDIRDGLENIGKDLGLEIRLQHKDVFEAMHRI